MKKVVFGGDAPIFVQILRKNRFLLLFSIRIMKLFFPAAYQREVFERHGGHKRGAGRDFFKFPSAGKHLPAYNLLY